jgi:predicted amidohydrolase
MSTLRFTLIQSHLHWEDSVANRTMFEEKINGITEPMEIVVLPEMFNTGFSMQPNVCAETMDGDTVSWMKRIAAEHKIILTGSLMIREGAHYFNRLVWMQPDSKFGTYDKRHLFSYGGEDNEFTPGDKRLIAQVKGWKICTMICYDLRFPVWSRMATENDYDVLMYVANWPIKRIGAWKALLQARAIENQCYVIGLNRTGIDGNGLHYPGESCIIGPLGDIIYSKPEVEDIATIQLDKDVLNDIRASFPFQKDKDEFIIL